MASNKSPIPTSVANNTVPTPEQVQQTTAKILSDSKVATEYLQYAKRDLEERLRQEAPDFSEETLSDVDEYHNLLHTLHDHHTNNSLAVSKSRVLSHFLPGETKSGLKAKSGCDTTTGKCTCEHPATISNLSIDHEGIKLEANNVETVASLNKILSKLNIKQQLTPDDAKVKKVPAGADNGLGPYKDHFTVDNN
jgi:hypothetical protein